METFPKEIGVRPISYFYIDIPVPDIEYRTGNAAFGLQMKCPEYILILQVCNDIGAYGAGFSGKIEEYYPGVKAAYKSFIKDKLKNNIPVLGLTQYLHVDDEVVLANMIAQRGIRTKPNDPVALDYTALRSCLLNISRDFVLDFEKTNLRWTIQMPRIGCGLAGGDWSKVADIIKTTLCAAGASPIVYDPPKYSR